MKALIFHREATAELDSAIAHYETQRGGLGLEFLAEVEAAAARVRFQPSMFAVSRELATVRKCALKRFPYALYYRELDDCIWIAAVAHHKRRPGYWTQRSPADFE